MKKILSLALAAAMVLSLASVAMADGITVPGLATAGEAENVNWYSYDSGVEYGANGSGAVDTMLYGKSYYAPLVTTYVQDEDDLADGEKLGTATINGDAVAVTSADVIKGINPKLDWEMNGSLIEDVEIVKAKNLNSKTYQYWLKVTTVSGSSTSVKDVIGTITLKKTGKFKTEVDVPFSMTVGVPAASSLYIEDASRVFEFDEDALPEEEDAEFTFEDFEDTYFTVNTIGQKKVVLQADSDFNEDVAAKYPDANLDFFNGNGGSFNKTGVLTLFADEGSYLYVLNKDGTLSASTAEYDEYEEAFIIKTRTLGSYVISDTDLGIEAPAVTVVPEVTDTPSTEVVETPEATAPVNPVGGAIA